MRPYSTPLTASTCRRRPCRPSGNNGAHRRSSVPARSDHDRVTGTAQKTFLSLSLGAARDDRPLPLSLCLYVVGGDLTAVLAAGRLLSLTVWSTIAFLRRSDGRPSPPSSQRTASTGLSSSLSCPFILLQTTRDRPFGRCSPPILSPSFPHSTRLERLTVPSPASKHHHTLSPSSTSDRRSWPQPSPILCLFISLPSRLPPPRWLNPVRQLSPSPRLRRRPSSRNRGGSASTSAPSESSRAHGRSLQLS